ncbi:MAG: discoidin domain-containing protein [Thermoleophilia bacterium]|nr:discoidin domain-containing protein [Thermoleophilia bacterium]
MRPVTRTRIRMPRVDLWRRAPVVAAVAAGALAAGAIQPADAAAADCAVGSRMIILAHTDDDLVFLNPDVAKDIASGACVRTVYLTAGDEDRAQWYWGARERGIMAAYAQMAGVANAWSTSDAGIAGHPILVRTLVGAPRISLAFMRMPDGILGTGGTLYGNQSLKQLFNGDITQIDTVDGTTSYTAAQLRQTLTALMADRQPQVIRIQDYKGNYLDPDHSDHLSAAFFSDQAQQNYATPHVTVGYKDNPTRDLPANVAGQELTTNLNAWGAYVPFDALPCGPAGDCTGTVYETWLQRRYTIGYRTGGSPGDRALNRPAMASSSNGPSAPGLANDGDAATRWQSAPGSGPQTWQADFGQAQTVSGVAIQWAAEYASTYRIQGSTDGTTFTTLATENPTSAQTVFTHFAPTAVRYLRVVADTPATPQGVSIVELSAMSPGGTANLAPIAGAGARQRVQPGDPVTLDGSGSIDPEGQPLTYQWTQTAGPVVALAGATSARPTFTAPAVNGDLQFRLVVNDGVNPSVPSTVTITVGPSDLAAEGVASASSVEQPEWGPENALDNEPITRWSAAYHPTDWWQVDLGEAMPVGTVEVNWETAFASRYQIQVSNDGVNFTTVANVRLSQAELRTTTFPQTNARYVRVLCLEHGTPYTYSIRDVRVFSTTDGNRAPTANAGPDQVVANGATVTLNGSGSSDPDNDPLTYRWTQTGGPAVTLSNPAAASPTFTAPAQSATLAFALEVTDGNTVSNVDAVQVTAGLPDLALTGTASASSTEVAGFGPANAIDGNSSTRWSAALESQSWLQVDLGAVQGIDTVEVSWEAAFASRYEIQTSTNGTSFATVATVTQAAAGIRRTTFPSTAARYVRVRCLEHGSPYTYSIYSLSVFGSGTPGNRAPVANAGPDFAVDLGATGTLNAGASSDPDGEALTYQWTQTAGPAVAITNANTATATFTAPAQSTALTFQVAVSDGKATSTDTVEVTAGRPNLAPAGTASASSVEVASFAAANANDNNASTRWSAAVEPDTWWQVDLGTAQPVDTVEVAWEAAYASQYEIQTSTDGTTFTTAATVNLSAAGVQRTTFTGRTARYVRIRCLQRGSIYTYSIFEVKVFGSGQPPVNQAPVANAGPDQSVAGGATVTLNGSASSDPDSDPLTYAWTQTAGPAVTLSSATAQNPTFTAPAAGGTLTFRLVVNDGTVASAPDTVTITASGPGNRAPVANAGPDQANFANSMVQLDGTASTDPDGDSLTYTWSQVSGPAATLSSATAAKPTFVSAEATGTYVFQLIVNDGTVAGPADTVSVTTTTPQNLATNKPATASTFEADWLTPGAGNDGDASTRWSTANLDNQWWQVDLGAGSTVGSVEIDWETAYATNYRIQTSNDGVTFGTVATVVFSTGPGIKRTTFTPVTTRYVRIQTDARQYAWWGVSFWEARVFQAVPFSGS